MSTTFQRMAQSQQVPIGKAVVGKKPDPGPGKVGVKVKAAIFFDGTGNNQSNIKKRLKDSSYMVPGHFTSDDSRASYEQYYSNVAILYFMHKKRVPGERIASVYVEGIGTTNDGDDDTPGSGFGSGPTGIVDRVTWGINKLRGAINKTYYADTEYLEELTVYVFGFSRGAAAARHFCARRANSRGRANNLCQALRVAPAAVTIKFVGLFDSVSSFDDTGNEPGKAEWSGKARRHGLDGDKEFLNDVAELHLTFDADPQVQQVMHLVAADEYRLNFSCTTIGSAVRQGKGLDVRLPGAHSDIGGGYADNLLEERRYSGWGNNFDFFNRQGWYGPGQTTQREGFAMGGPESPVVKGVRRVPNTYQYVALSIMLKLTAKAESGMQFGNPNTEDAERRPGEAERGVRYIIAAGHPLYTVKTALEAYAMAQYDGPRAEIPPTPQALPAYHPLAEAQYKWLRQHYLHLSWKDELGFEYRKDGRAIPYRLLIAG
jgi:hypothetical protein